MSPFKFMFCPFSTNCVNETLMSIECFTNSTNASLHGQVTRLWFNIQFTTWNERSSSLKLFEVVWQYYYVP